MSGVSVQALETLAEAASIASSAAPPVDRIKGVVRSLSDVMPHVAAHVASIERRQVRTLHSDGYPELVLDRFLSPAWVDEAVDLLQDVTTNATALRQQDLPNAENITVSAYLRPAGFPEGITRLMTDERGDLCAVLNLSCQDKNDATDEARTVVRHIGGLMTNIVSEAAMVADAESVFVLHRDGRVSHRSGDAAIGDRDGTRLVTQELDRLGSVRASLSGISTEPDGTLSHEMQVVPLASFAGASTTALVVIREAQLSSLTPREVEVVRLIARGLSNTEIAQELAISRRTVGSHVEHILTRLGVKSRTSAAVFASQNGLLGPGDV